MTPHAAMIAKLAERRSVKTAGFRQYLKTQIHPEIWDDWSSRKVIPDAWRVHIQADGTHECIIYEVVHTNPLTPRKMWIYGFYADSHEFDCNFRLIVMNHEGVIIKNLNQWELEPYGTGLP